MHTPRVIEVTKHADAARNLVAALKTSEGHICSGYEVYESCALVWACICEFGERVTYTYTVRKDGSYTID